VIRAVTSLPNGRKLRTLGLTGKNLKLLEPGRAFYELAEE